MGIWQLDRGEYKDNLQLKIEQRRDLSPVTMQKLPHTEEERIYLPVQVKGQFDNEHQFLHDNRILNRHVGYHVYTPLHLISGETILVNRGWVKQGDTRRVLPDITVVQEEVEFTGLLDRVPSRGLVLSDRANEQAEWPMILQYVDVSEIETLLGYKLLPIILWMDQNSEYIYRYDMPVLQLDSSKNYGYTFQWFAMALTIFILYIALNTKKAGFQHDG